MVTFRVAEGTEPQSVANKSPKYKDHYVETLKEYKKEGLGRILQGTSFDKAEFQQSSNGFVHGVTHAYNRHHNLVIRPDDVWIAIIVQFALFVNGNSEAMRSIFVDHEGKKELEVVDFGSLYTADYGRLATKMTMELNKNVKDPQLCNWVLPSFSTTTKNDVVVGSVALMATLKSYFEYKISLLCGIPYVTLLGSTEDWEEIHHRVDQLKKYGKECTQWHGMLKKVIAQFVQSSKDQVDGQFWNKICHHIGGGSGPTYLSGWITVFSVFNNEGKWQGRIHDDMEYPIVDTHDISPGYLTVDVKVDDNGMEHETLMFAGHMGYDVVDNGKGLAPKLTWAIALKNKKAGDGVCTA